MSDFSDNSASLEALGQRGFSLVEILITILIIGVGLMGTATLQLTGLGSNQGAYLRSQASILVYDMADRLRGNPDRAIAGEYNGFTFKTGEGNTLDTLASFAGTCISQTNGCSRSKQSDNDKYEWASSLMGAGSSGVALLPGAMGTIDRGVGNLFTVTVSWDEDDWKEKSDIKESTNKSFSVSFTIEPINGVAVAPVNDGGAV